MPTDDDKSLGDEATFQRNVKRPAKEEQSLGDRSTFHGGDASSISDLGEFGNLPDHDMEIVDLSGRYKIEETLGQGGMGEVLLATDTRLDRKVAIKRIRGDAGSSKAAVARFLTEAKSVAALNHPNVVHVYDYGRDESGPFMIMEYVSGGSLLDHCKQGPIELEKAVDLACQLCDGLGRAHDAGIIHRDIKPANILLTADGIPKLTDFGLAKAESRDHTMTMAGAVLGTLDFMPPEQRQDASLTDSRSDLWSLAASLYQMVTGKSPKVIRLKKVPSQIRDVLDKALEESKEDRYQTAVELRIALQDAKGGQPISFADLDEGQCASCGVKNPSSRKFCKECAASLVIDCLKCESSIQIWDNVCGECGCIQEEILSQRREAMNLRRSEAEENIQDLDFDNARQIATEIQNEPDVRLGQLKTWSVEFLEEIDNTWKREQDRAGELLSEAIKHESAKDYEAGIRTLEQVAGIFRNATLPGQNETVEKVLDRLVAIQDRLEELKKQVRKRIKQRKLDGLMVDVESLIELAPHREDFRKLKDQLIAREEKITRQIAELCAQAEELLSRGDHRAALKLFEKVDSKRLSQSQIELNEKLSGLVASEDSLISAVQAAKADGVIELHEIDSLLSKVNALLSLIPNHSSALQLLNELNELNERREKLREDRESFYNEAMAAFTDQDYPRCLAVLKKIDRTLANEEVHTLREQAEDAKHRVAVLDRQITTSLATNELNGLLKQLEEYLFLHKADAERQNLYRDLREKRQKYLLERIEREPVENPIEQRLIWLREYLELFPEDQQKKELHNQLNEEFEEHRVARDEQYRAAKSLFASQEYEEALQILEQVPRRLMNTELIELKTECVAILRKLQHLKENIDSESSPETLESRLSNVNKFLSLKHDVELEKLKVFLEELKPTNNSPTKPFIFTAAMFIAQAIVLSVCLLFLLFTLARGGVGFAFYFRWLVLMLSAAFIGYKLPARSIAAATLALTYCLYQISNSIFTVYHYPVLILSVGGWALFWVAIAIVILRKEGRRQLTLDPDFRFIPIGAAAWQEKKNRGRLLLSLAFILCMAGTRWIEVSA